MVYGLYMGLFLVFKFFTEVMSLNSGGFALLYGLCVLLIPVLAFLFSFRLAKNMPEAELSYWNYFRFIFYVFFYAGMILAVAQYVYFAFINPGFIQSQYDLLLNNLDLLSETMPVFSQYESVIGQLEPPTPAMMVYQTIWIYVVAGVLLGFPIAAIARAVVNKKKNEQ